MIEVYVEMDPMFEHVTSYSTNRGMIKVIQDDPVFDVSKMRGYTLKLDEQNQYHLVFDENLYAKFLEEQKRNQDIQASLDLGKQMLSERILATASDKEAYALRYLYPEWVPNMSVEPGNRVLYADQLYKCKQAHTTQEQYTPNVVPALWDMITEEGGSETLGTIDNPIIVPDVVSSMVYIKGKYYLEDGVLYLMNRQGMNDGEEIALTFKPSALVGHYFEVV